MNNDKLETVASCMESMDNEATVWSMVRAVSHLMEAEGVTYNQCIAVFDTILHYATHEAEIMSSDLPDEENIDLDGEDGEWFEIPAIG